MLDRPYVVLDFETTGLRAADRVIEIAAVRFDGERQTTFHTLCHPGRQVPSFITGLTGITDDDLAGAPPTTEAIRRFMAELMHDQPILVAHNASFDRRFLDQELALAGLPLYAGPVLCTMQLSRRLFPQLRSHRLNVLLEFHQIAMGRHHRALDDVQGTTLLLQALLRAAQGAGLDLSEPRPRRSTV